MMSEQKAGKLEGNDSLDNFIRQAIGKEPSLSCSRAGDSPVHWIQLLHALDQQGTNKLSKGPKINNIAGGKDHLEHCNGVSSYSSGTNGVKESLHSIKSSGVPVKGTKSASEHMQTLKIPEAVVAFAQAAAKANGEPEKYLPGWPMLSPKVQMQKCDKCSREFCSPINYRRHIRVHRRSLNVDKDSSMNRDLLGAFWDKLSLDECKEIVSFSNVMLEEVPGSSIVRALTSFIRKPGFPSLPQTYIKAGSTLLDVVQGRPSRFPISSQELFSVLDDACEKTFLCAGTAVSVQKFVFDGEATKIGLEMKNLVACTSFLVEQKLVKAWLADKDAEALRCQKLLVEEEEAAQKRQAELLERRRLKKLRQKQQKSKEQTDGDKKDFKEGSPDALEDLASSPEKSSSVAASDSHTSEELLDPIQLLLVPAQLMKTDVEGRGHAGFSYPDIEMASVNTSSANCQNIDHRTQQGSGRRQLIVARKLQSKPQRGATPNGFQPSQNSPILKLGVVQKHGTYRDQRATLMTNGHKVWTRKMKPEIEAKGLSFRLQRESVDQPDQNDNCEVLIGSISVTLGECSGHHQGDILAAALDQCTAEHQPPKRNHIQDKLIKPDSGQSGTNRSMIKLWRPVGRHATGGSMTVQSHKREAEVDVFFGKCIDQTLSNESCLAQGAMDDDSYESRDDSPILVDSTNPGGLGWFFRHAAEAFLTQRWKEAIATDHVKLILSPETEPVGSLQIQDDDALVVGQLPSDSRKFSILGNAENHQAGLGPLELSTTGPTKTKFRGKPEKGCRLKYIPKQRNST